MSYQVEITPFAQRQIKKLSPDIQAKIIGKLEALVEVPQGNTKNN
ncbi:MAG: hypothetical protein AAFV71_29270 [Cyanobacteria bacterium J06633_8]